MEQRNSLRRGNGEVNGLFLETRKGVDPSRPAGVSKMDASRTAMLRQRHRHRLTGPLKGPLYYALYIRIYNVITLCVIRTSIVQVVRFTALV